MKTGPDALGKVENESEQAHHENGSQNVKKEPDAVCTAENESGSAKHEKWT
jgi:hypothetical protein